MNDLWAYERGIWARGRTLVAGVDEAGRGPLAGPVTAAAVILLRTFHHPDLRDSKLLTAKKRDMLAPLIKEGAVAWCIASSGERQIERENILQATLDAMRRAVAGLRERPDCLLVDAVHIPELTVPQRSIVKGDRLSASIAAASILAKVERDRIMAECDSKYPHYGFRRHKGYGTAEHLRAIAKFGPCEAHRRTFRGVREHLEAPSPPSPPPSRTARRRG